MTEPVYVIQHSGRLSEAGIRALLRHWKDAMGETKCVILQEGATIKQLAPCAEELPIAADLLEEKGFEDLANWLRRLADGQPIWADTSE